MNCKLRFIFNSSVLIILGVMLFACQPEKIDFNTQIKPLLNKNCMACHGGVKQSGGFSLLFREEALDTTNNGIYAIVPGFPDQSELIRRITHHDPEFRMPYGKDPLTDEQIELLTQWIKEGAEWGTHWAYIPPSRTDFSSVPDASKKDVNPIDAIIYQKHKELGLNASLEQRPEQLIRRLSFDITGLPPKPEWVELYRENPTTSTYNSIVMELLSSNDYGEKWASWWLDLARYADSKGYEADRQRTYIWHYRDWVIKAFNKDMPFDQFTTEQLAGDLLDNPNDDQLIATAFHRNTMTNDEGGTDNEEFRIAAVIDRVNTTMTTWQSTTFGCVQCHSHPYDPFKQQDYYKFLALFNNTADYDLMDEYPRVSLFDTVAEMKFTNIKNWANNSLSEKDKLSLLKMIKVKEPKLYSVDVHQYKDEKLQTVDRQALRFEEQWQIKNVNLSSKKELLIKCNIWKPNTIITIRNNGFNGEILFSGKIEQSNSIKSFSLPMIEKTVDLYVTMSNRDPGGYFFIDWVSIQPDYFIHDSKLKQTYFELLNGSFESVAVMSEKEEEYKRATHEFIRGNFSTPGAKTSSDIPAYFKSLNNSTSTVSNRLELANWLNDENNPLTSRTLVNRVWEQLFGLGIVPTMEDFGTQGEPPSNQLLLDWLSVQFISADHWSIKKLVYRIVTSNTYKQTSEISVEHRKNDPQNIYLSYGPRLRLTHEEIRDQLLSASGLLSKKMYGPSVMPHQPDGFWQSVYNDQKWVLSEGEDRYRRAIYTYFKRTNPYPNNTIFDGPTRDVCSAFRINTNTPLQALASLNDPVGLIAAQYLAVNVLEDHQTVSEQIQTIYYRLLYDFPNEDELKSLMSIYEASYEEFSSGRADLSVFILPELKPNADLAALSVVTNVIFNLDATLMK